MPATDTREDQRVSARVFSILFWVGVALAPVAALMLVISSGTGGLKTALGIVIISVILIGVSITLRRDSDGLRGELEETVFDEIDALRADVRADINQAAQATHRAFGEKMQYLLEQLETTRAELEATRVHVDAIRNGFTGPPSSHRQAAAPQPSMHQATGRAVIPPGVVRHTETVQVTTRHTVMDPHEESRGTTYGSRSSAVPAGESWTEQRLREQFDRRHEDADDRWRLREPAREPAREPIREPVREPMRDPLRESYEDDDRRLDSRPSVRAGDRWASVRSDDRGRELRMGERRAALHSDSSGTELRIEDRWAAVRREAGLPAPRMESSWRFEDGRITDARADDDRGYDAGRYESRHDGGRQESARFDGGGFSDDRLDTPRGDFPYRDQRDRRALTSADREERWSDYQHQDYQSYQDDRGYERRYR